MAGAELYADQPRWNKTSKGYNEVAKRLERQYAVREEA